MKKKAATSRFVTAKQLVRFNQQSSNGSTITMQKPRPTTRPYKAYNSTNQDLNCTMHGPQIRHARPITPLSKGNNSIKAGPQLL